MGRLIREKILEIIEEKMEKPRKQETDCKIVVDLGGGDGFEFNFTNNDQIKGAVHLLETINTAGDLGYIEIKRQLEQHLFKR